MTDENGLLLKCKTCKGKNFEVVDEVIDDDACHDVPESNRFEEVAKLESMTHEERFEFWRGELSRCIRCNALPQCLSRVYVSEVRVRQPRVSGGWRPRPTPPTLFRGRTCST